MTMIGYGLMANQVLAAMGAHARVDLQALATEIERKNLPSALWIDLRGDGVLTHFRLFLSHADHAPLPARNCVKDKASCAISSAMDVNTRH
jgi:hypothetical protein